MRSRSYGTMDGGELCRWRTPMSEPLRLSAGLALVLLATACHRAPAPSAAPARCEPGVSAHAQHPLATKPRELAGDYELIQVQTQPNAGVTSSGRLHLAPLDSAARAGAVGGAVRDLIGWLEPSRRDSAAWGNATSRDRDKPGAVVSGQHLILGDLAFRDGYVEHLTITAVAPEGFWGWWKAQQGIEMALEADVRRALPDPAGYFCARRVQP